MKPVKLFHNDDTLSCVSFDDGTWIFWQEDRPMLVAYPGSPPEPYEDGDDEIIDDLMNDPKRLYELPSEQMDATREAYVKTVLCGK